MSTRISSKRPHRRCTSESNSSNGKIMQSVDSNLDSDASYGSIHGPAAPPRMDSAAPSNAPIDVEAIDDDVELLSSSRVFPQIRNKPRRTPPITVILDEDGDMHAGSSGASISQRSTRAAVNGQSRQSVPSKARENLSLDHEHKKRRVEEGSEGETEQPAAKEQAPSFSCSICWGKLEEETSTVCGHIFCLACIKAAIQAQKKCPSCRRPLTMRNIHRIYLPLSK